MQSSIQRLSLTRCTLHCKCFHIIKPERSKLINKQNVEVKYHCVWVWWCYRLQTDGDILPLTALCWRTCFSFTTTRFRHRVWAWQRFGYHSVWQSTHTNTGTCYHHSFKTSQRAKCRHNEHILNNRKWCLPCFFKKIFMINHFNFTNMNSCPPGVCLYLWGRSSPRTPCPVASCLHGPPTHSSGTATATVWLMDCWGRGLPEEMGGQSGA